MPVWVTYDSSTDRHYLNVINCMRAGLPILKPSTKQVGVANDGVSDGTHVTHLPFTQISHKSSNTETFKDFPNSLMSFVKTSNEDTVSVFTKDDVKVYHEEDVFITCKNKPILNGFQKRATDTIASRSKNVDANGSPAIHPRRP